MSVTVSVVVPTRDRVGLLTQTLHTVLSQDVDLEVIVVDEGSTDDTAAMLRHLGDDRVRTIRHDPPRGLSHARNAGIEAATGRWLAFVDDDDLWFPGKLADQVAAAEAAGAPWVYGGAISFRTDGPTLLALDVPTSWRTVWHRLPQQNVVPGGGSNAIVAREALDTVGGFDPTIPIVADWDLWIRLLAVGPPAVVTRPVVAYRIHAGNMTHDFTTMIAATAEIERRYEHLRAGAPFDWVSMYRWLSRWALRSGDHRAARRTAAAAMRAGHPGGVRHLARATLPLRPRDPVGEPWEADTLLDRFTQRAVLPWPDGARSWLETVLAVEQLDDRSAPQTGTTESVPPGDEHPGTRHAPE